MSDPDRRRVEEDHGELAGAGLEQQPPASGQAGIGLGEESQPPPQEPEAGEPAGERAGGAGEADETDGDRGRERDERDRDQQHESGRLMLEERDHQRGQQPDEVARVAGGGIDRNARHHHGHRDPLQLERLDHHDRAAQPRGGERLVDEQAGDAQAVAGRHAHRYPARPGHQPPDLTLAEVRRRLQQPGNQDPVRARAGGESDELPALGEVQGGEHDRPQHRQAEQPGEPAPPDAGARRAARNGGARLDRAGTALPRGLRAHSRSSLSQFQQRACPIDPALGPLSSGAKRGRRHDAVTAPA